MGRTSVSKTRNSGRRGKSKNTSSNSKNSRCIIRSRSCNSVYFSAVVFWIACVLVVCWGIYTSTQIVIPTDVVSAIYPDNMETIATKLATSKHNAVLETTDTVVGVANVAAGDVAFGSIASNANANANTIMNENTNEIKNAAIDSPTTDPKEGKETRTTVTNDTYTSTSSTTSNTTTANTTSVSITDYTPYTFIDDDLVAWRKRRARKDIYNSWFENGTNHLKDNADEYQPQQHGHGQEQELQYKRDSDFPILDFVITGFPKCGTTALMRNLAAATTMPPETDVCTPPENTVYYAYHSWARQYGPSNRKPLKGNKCPSYLDTGSIPGYAAKLPRTRLIVGIRHPVTWFQSFHIMVSK